MIRVGLTGGLASGKSFVGRTLEELGCHLVRADELGHAVLARGGEAYEGVIREFGPAILDASGEINRRRLAAEAFADAERLAILNGLVHPPVIRREEELIEQASRKDPNGIVVVEAAILIETGSYKRFERLILVVCSEEEQIRRAMHRDAYTLEEAQARLRRQLPLSEKRKFADYVIDTTGTKEMTVAQTREVYESLRSIRQ
ncbi:MAG: dephospho-CoA kinase [Bryobacteraceae bacterium]